MSDGDYSWWPPSAAQLAQCKVCFRRPREGREFEFWWLVAPYASRCVRVCPGCVKERRRVYGPEAVQKDLPADRLNTP